MIVTESRFFPLGRKSSHMRLSYSAIDMDQDAEEGLKRLSAAIKERQAHA